VISAANGVQSGSAGASGNDGESPREEDLSSGQGLKLTAESHSNHTEPELTDRPSAPIDPRPPVQSTPQQSKSKTYLKTPLIMGAWIETPLPAGTKGLPMPTPNEVEDGDENQFDLGVDAGLIKRGAEDIAQGQLATANLEITYKPSLAETAPLLPKSALAAIIEKAKRNRSRADDDGAENVDDTLLLDDSTIQSLEELLASDSETPAIAAPEPSTGTTPSHDTRHDSTHPPITDLIHQEQAVDENPPEQEAQSYDRITRRLSQVGLSIRDAKKGIASLERAVSSAPSRLFAAPAATNDECVEAGEFHDFIWPCERCGCLGRSDIKEDAFIDWHTVRLPIPRLWTWRKEDWRPRLTWLGVVTAVAWALVGGEWIAHKMYSPPFYASSIEGYGVDYNAPRPPFLLAKLLWRSPLGMPLQSLYFVLTVLVRLFSSIFGFSAGFFGHSDGNVVDRRPWIYTEAEVGTVEWPDDGRMERDEYL